MDFVRLQREQIKSNPNLGKCKKLRAANNAGFHRPLTLTDERPSLRLGHTLASHNSLSYPLQAKLTISQPRDQYDQEADRVADQVMRMSDPAIRLQRKCGCGGDCGACQKGQSAPEHLQTSRVHGGSPAHMTAPAIVHEALRSSGQPLDSGTRAFFEQRFGHDFSRVRIHADDRASAAAQAVEASAFTVGQDMVFAHGQYAPETSPGQKLLAHELTHSIQQRAVAPKMLQRQGGGRTPRRTIWINIGFDSSARANEETMRRLRGSVAVEKAAITNCCAAHNLACNINVKTRYDWVRHNKPAPADNDYDTDVAADRTLLDRNLGNIVGHAGGRRVLVTESTLSQTWQGVRLFPRANTGVNGILWNRALAADDTLAHESGHGAGYSGGDIEGGAHSSDATNLMSRGDIRGAGAVPDANWCQQMATTAI